MAVQFVGGWGSFQVTVSVRTLPLGGVAKKVTTSFYGAVPLDTCPKRLHKDHPMSGCPGPSFGKVLKHLG